AVVGQHLAGELRVNRVGELARFVEVGLRGFAPQQVGVGSVGQAAGNRRLQASAIEVEAIDGALTGNKIAVAGIVVTGDQSGRVGVGARDDHGWHAHGVGRKTSGDQFLRGFFGGNQDLAAEVSALLGGRQLVLEVNGSG